MEETQGTKWYDRTWLVILLCITIFPVGLYALWKNRSIAIGWKLGYTALLALALFIPRAEPKTTEPNPADEPPPTASAAEAKPELTQHQKDSVAKAEKVAELEARKKNTVTAENLVQHYVNNEVRADGIFKDKTFYVEGVIADIGKDIMNNIYVTLDGPSGDFRKVQCFFNDADMAAQLEKGYTVAFEGRCSGLMMNVLMKDCQLVKGTWALEEEIKALP